ncbi:serine-tRNA ligase [Conidiobolus coronatus NRRL 28638]|uniref:serine--tRNA ligase n=1 Tax=Conidiobolus coronatus (strain ATCC 28846 / CBS 209.66 / NRRL 28638) TaxID=796925 RepID=A0A137P717_CONC2|nr:serine-tRNA ligase [Conidiobolus coronatus NRRL 28638]|eukprot:KXN70785.1 serine-tRNA ligase [Conidiobolus coronatus NRRL 28638]
MLKLIKPTKLNRILTNNTNFSTYTKLNVGIKSLGILPKLNWQQLKDSKLEVEQNIINRKLAHLVNLDEVLQVHREYGEVQFKINGLRNKKQLVSQKLSKAGKEERLELINEAQAIKEEIHNLEPKLNELNNKALRLGCLVPNFTHPSSPIGPEENANIVLKKEFNHEYPSQLVKNHYDLSISHKMVDFEQAAKVTGNSFYYLKNDGALLELALVDLVVKLGLEKGYRLHIVPDIVKEDILKACGFQPRDSHLSQTYGVSSSHEEEEANKLCLSGTSEVQLAGLYLNQQLQKSQLPIQLMGKSHCFRAEAGARGSETRGLYRVHQFTKLELFELTDPSESDEALDKILEFQKSILDKLELSYRVLDMPTEELGSSAYKKYDIETWLPGSNKWGEVSSASNCTDYQSRRLNIRLPKQSTQKSPQFVHTLNGTACAIPRIIVSILEQYQTAEGKVKIPSILKPYFNNREFFTKGEF